MLEVTDTARERLKMLLDANKEEPEECIRITMDESGNLGLTLSKEKPGDQVVEHEGEKVLLLDPIITEALSNVIVDTEDSTDDSKLTLKRKPEN